MSMTTACPARRRSREEVETPGTGVNVNRTQRDPTGARSPETLSRGGPGRRGAGARGLELAGLIQ